jgi:hypothetical protein
MSAKRAEYLLLDLANMKATHGETLQEALRNFRHFYPDIFGNRDNVLDCAALFTQLLRHAWEAVDQRKRDWFLADLEALYHRTTNRWNGPPDIATPMEALVYYFRRNARRALRCPNPDCEEPYFLASKKGQKFCSPKCARPAQLESKRRWWSKRREELKAEKRKGNRSAKS